jgi:hypothetical protein
VNVRLLLCIAMGVFMAHLAAFMVYFTVRSRQLPPPPVPQKPNFKYTEEVVTNPRSGDRFVNREITVTTSLRGDLYKSPGAEAAKK